MDGVLVVRKEKGYTSHDVVAKLRGILHMKKIGHTGTLDPDAEGVLPLVLGKATKLAELLTDKEKTYQTVLRLGIETDTEDMTGTVLNELPVTVSEEEVRAEVRRAIAEYAPYGAYIPCITYGLPESIFPGVLECIMDEVNKYNEEHMAK